MNVSQMREDYRVKSMGILISSEKLVRSDDGVIIVGGSFVHRSHSHRYGGLGLVRSDRVGSDIGVVVGDSFIQISHRHR